MFSSITKRIGRRGGALFIGLTLSAMALMPAASGVLADQEQAEFPLVIANTNLLPCLAENASDSRHQPTVTASVERGDVNDTLKLHLRNFKPGLAFDLFTVQRSNKLADGKADPNFTNFGLAWYQSDVQADSDGNANVTVKTILLDQIFGFDPDVKLAPTNTFNLGFWFNDPKDAAACGFDVTKPTPFNGDHHAGPLAFITLPDANTGLGPLCRNPQTSTSGVTCNP